MKDDRNVQAEGRSEKSSVRRRVRLSPRQSEAFDSGDLSAWSDEELRRGYRKDKHGGWSGRPPKVIPANLHQELVKRVMDQAGAVLRDSLVEAVQLYREVVRDPDAPVAAKLAAADRIADRMLGKPKLAVEVNAELKVPRWQTMIDKIIMDDPEDGDIIAGEIVMPLDNRPFTAEELDDRPRQIEPPPRPARREVHDDDASRPWEPITPPRRMDKNGVVVDAYKDFPEFTNVDDRPPSWDREGVALHNESARGSSRGTMRR